MKPHGRLDFLDALKGLAILGVVLIHMGFAGRFDAAALGAVHALQEGFTWSVLAFFFASGSLHRSSGHLDEGWCAFAKKRAWRLLVPCAAFSWLYKLLLLAAHRAGFMSAAPPSLATATDIACFFLTPAAPQFYFLVHLFIISLAVHAIMRLPALRESRRAGRVLPWWIAAALLQCHWLLPFRQLHGEAPGQLPLYAALYLAGVEASRHPQMRGLLRDPGFIGFIPAVGILAAAQPGLLWIFAPLALTAALRRIPSPAALAPLAFLGRRSGGIYAWHTPIVMPLLSIALTRLHLSGWPLVAAMIFTTPAISLALDSLVRRLDPRGIFRL